jgi:hypothetical protein
VSDAATVWLAIMAAALVVMAAVQIGLILVAVRVGRQVNDTMNQMRREVGPLLVKVHAVVDDAARATTLAAMQVERVDQLLSTSCQRIDEIVGLAQNVIGGSLRQAGTAVTAFRAALSLLRSWQTRHKRSAREDEDALFVG